MQVRFSPAALMRSGLSAVLLASMAACATAPTPPPPSDYTFAEPPYPASESVARFENDLTTLASDAFEGREAGTAGYLRAADYVRSSYEAIGLKPAGTDGYFQSVPLREATPQQAAATLEIGDQSFTPGGQFIMLAAPSEGTVRVEAELVYMGYGIDAPQLGFTAYQDIDVTDKIVVVRSGAPDGLPSEESAHFRGTGTKREIARSHGAKGLIVVADRDVSGQLRRYAAFPSNLVVHPRGQEPMVEAAAMLSNGATKQLLKAAGKDPKALAENTLPIGSLGITAVMGGETAYKDYSAPNVVGVLEGSDPELKDEYVVLTAHLDHVGILNQIAPIPGKDVINNGAMDNASGISTLLEEARKFVSDERPRRSVLFVALTAEEKGLLGSEYFARNPTVPAEGMVANVNLDMPILLHDFTDVIAFGAQHSSLWDVTKEAGAGMGVELMPDPVPEMVLFVRSDHYNFVKVGVPSVFLFLGFGNGGEDKFNYFMENHYHRPSDQPGTEALPIRFDVGAKFAEINYRIAKAIANDDERPTWNAGDFFGETFSAPKNGS